ncbi:MAG: hypothetical protein M1401_03370 [Chloroflexi bacterium]|nr:hypothetical protein [Chloroflexota bacterium]MCL5107907.1 hypothetical protein [Chloroflexota bacterium]
MVTTFLGGIASGAGFALGAGGLSAWANQRQKKKKAEKKNPVCRARRGGGRRRGRRRRRVSAHP